MPSAEPGHSCWITASNNEMVILMPWLEDSRGRIEGRLATGTLSGQPGMQQ